MTVFDQSHSPLDRDLAKSEIAAMFGELVTGSVMHCIGFRNAIIREFGKPRGAAGRSPDREFMDAIAQVLAPPAHGGKLVAEVRSHLARIVVEADQAKKQPERLAQADHLLEAARHANAALQKLARFEPVINQAPGNTVSVEMQALVAEHVLATQAREKIAARRFLDSGTTMVRSGALGATDIAAACHDYYSALVPDDREQCQLGSRVAWAQITERSLDDFSRALRGAARLKHGSAIIVQEPSDGESGQFVMARHPTRPVQLQASTLADYRSACSGIESLVQATLVGCTAARLPPYIQGAIVGRPAAAMIRAAANLTPSAARVGHIKAPPPPQLLSGIPPRPTDISRITFQRQS